MDFLPTTVLEGGPWAVLLIVVLGVSFLYWRGIFVSSGQVDKTIAGYVATNAFLEKELAYWRAAADRKDLTIDRQTEQLQKMLSYSAVGTHALESFMKEVQGREQVDDRG
jgi:hypothetical protein